MRTIALLLLAASAASAAEPRFVVENKCPAFVVVNKTAAKPACGCKTDCPCDKYGHCPSSGECKGGCDCPLDYAEYLARVETGKKVGNLWIGTDPLRSPSLDQWGCFVPSLEGFEPGEYQCKLENGQPVMQLVRSFAKPKAVVPTVPVNPIRVQYPAYPFGNGPICLPGGK